MKKMLSFLFIYIWSMNTNAQQRIGPDPEKKQRLVLKITPSSLLDRFCAMLPLGVEYNYKKRLGIGGDWAIPVMSTKHVQNSNVVERFSRNIKPDVYLRYYFTPARKNQFFIGVEWFYKEQFYFTDRIYYANRGYELYVSNNAEVRRFVNGTGFYLGEKFGAGPHWTVEIYGGVGRKNVNNHVYADNIRYAGGHDEAIFPAEDGYDDRRSLLYFPFGLNIGYRF